MKNLIQAFLDSFRKCGSCGGRGVYEVWKGSGERMLVDGKLIEIATLESRKMCLICKGTGKRW